MTHDHEVLLSVLIPTLVSRQASCARLQAEIEEQVRATDSTGLIEVLTLCDSGLAYVGAKRNQLIEQSRGRFVVFIDDDDTVSGDYIRLILQAIRENEQADCICFAGEITFRGKHPRKLLHSIENRGWHYSKGDYVRPPCHITPIRREIAIRYRFANKNVAEDMEWTLRMSNDGALAQEVVLDETLYFYHCRRAFAKQWALDHTQTLRHKLGLRFYDREVAKVQGFRETEPVIRHQSPYRLRWGKLRGGVGAHGGAQTLGCHPALRQGSGLRRHQQALWHQPEPG